MFVSHLHTNTHIYCHEISNLSRSTKNLYNFLPFHSHPQSSANLTQSSWMLICEQLCSKTCGYSRLTTSDLRRTEPPASSDTYKRQPIVSAGRACSQLASLNSNPFLSLFFPRLPSRSTPHRHMERDRSIQGEWLEHIRADKRSERRPTRDTHLIALP